MREDESSADESVEPDHSNAYRYSPRPKTPLPFTLSGRPRRLFQNSSARRETLDQFVESGKSSRSFSSFFSFLLAVLFRSSHI